MAESQTTDSDSDDGPTNKELRRKIATRAAHRPPDNGLTKPIWNSLHAWFTGEFYVQPAMLKPGVPPKTELVDAVLSEAVAVQYEEIDDEDGLPPLEAYRVDEVKPAEDDEFPPRAMRKRELKDFVNAMSTAGDHREWSAGNQ